MDTVSFVIIIVAVAFVFDYTNGFHDAANSIATVVSTRVLSPRLAVIWAAFFNLIAFLILGTRVAKTVGGDLVHLENVKPDLRLFVVLAGVLGAIAWNITTWYLGLPTSSSHALIGGYGGAAPAALGNLFCYPETGGRVNTHGFSLCPPGIWPLFWWAVLSAVFTVLML